MRKSSRPRHRLTGLHQIVLRIRHPEGKPIRAVSVQGQPHHEFDAQGADDHAEAWFNADLGARGFLTFVVAVRLVPQTAGNS